MVQLLPLPVTPYAKTVVFYDSTTRSEVSIHDLYLSLMAISLTIPLYTCSMLRHSSRNPFNLVPSQLDESPRSTETHIGLTFSKTSS